MIRLFCVFLFSLHLTAWAAPGDLLDLRELPPLTKVDIEQLIAQVCAHAHPGNKLGHAHLRYYAVKYETTDVSGLPMIASGALVVPDTGPGPFPLVSYQHGTVLQRDDVPSRRNYEGMVVSACYGSQNSVVVAPDYLGYGDSPDRHPYLHLASEVSASVDMLRAARHASPLLGISFSEKLFLTGYSQGGGATMALHKHIQEVLPAEFKVTASTPMSGPYDLEKTFLTVFDEGTAHTVTEFAYAIWSLNPIYHFVAQLEEAILPNFPPQFDGLFDGSHDVNEVMGALPARLPDFLQPAFVAEARKNPNMPFRVALRENSVGDWAPTTPMYLLQGEADKEVPTLNTTETCARMQARNAPVKCTLIPGLDHVYAFALTVPLSVAWFNSF